MTFIANITVRDYPVLLGDVIISQPHPPSTQVSIPTAGQLREQIHGNHYIVGTGQKICVLNDSFAVAWSGARIHAKSLILQAEDELKKGASVEEVLHMFSESPSNREIEFIGIFERDGKISSFSVNTPIIENDHPVIDSIAVNSNNASAKFYGLIQESAFGDLKGYHPLDAAVAVALELGASMLTSDFHDLSSLENFYGGGLEIALWRNGRIEKVGNIVYVFWIYNLNTNNGTHQLLPIALKLDYIDGALVTQRVQFQSDGATRNNSYHIQIVQPRNRIIPEDQIKAKGLPSWEWELICSLALVIDGKNCTSFIRSWSRSTNRWISFERNSEGLFLSVSKDYLKSIIYFIESALRSRRPMD